MGINNEDLRVNPGNTAKRFLTSVNALYRIDRIDRMIELKRPLNSFFFFLFSLCKDDQRLPG